MNIVKNWIKQVFINFFITFGSKVSSSLSDTKRKLVLAIKSDVIS